MIRLLLLLLCWVYTTVGIGSEINRDYCNDIEVNEWNSLNEFLQLSSTCIISLLVGNFISYMHKQNSESSDGTMVTS